MEEDYRKFRTWVELLAWVEFDGTLYYQLTTELYPIEVRCIRHNDDIIITTLDGDHLLIADETHLTRFTYEDEAA